MSDLKPFRRRQLLEAIVKNLGLAQIGQKHDSTTSNGSEACTHVVWQFLIYIWTGVLVTIDEISKVAGYKPGDVGMNSTHVDRIIKHYRLPYVASWRTGKTWSAEDIMRTAREVGPVMVAVPYGFYPLNKNLDTHLVRTPVNGFAQQGGRVDLNFAGNHATCVFVTRWRTKLQEHRPRVLDPDHHYPRHQFDIISQQQFARMWDRNLVGKSYGQIAYVPTEPWNGLPDGAETITGDNL